MMHMMGFTFRGIGMFGGFVLIFVIPAVIFFGAKLVRRLTALNSRRLSQNESRTPKVGVQSLQSEIMVLALNNSGVLTATDVVIATGLSIKQAEETLNSMVDGYRIKMEVRDSGIIAYEFTELMNGTEGTSAI